MSQHRVDGAMLNVEMIMIKSFRGEYRWLSNFYNCDVELWGFKFKTVENAYQASKSSNIDDWYKMVNCKTPFDAKRLGRKILIREDFDFIKINIMDHLLRQKFQDPYFKRKLIETGDQLIQEGNQWGDTFWGVCNGIGHNNLGKLIMNIRTSLRS